MECVLNLSVQTNHSPEQTLHMLLEYLSMFGIEHMQSLPVAIVLCSGLSFDVRTQMLRIRCLSVQTNHSPEQTQHMLLAYLSMFGIEHMQSLLVAILLYITLPSDGRTQMLCIRCLSE